MIVDLTQRIELAELALREQTRKWDLFIGDVTINSKAAMLSFEEREMLRKSVDQLYLRVQDLESQQQH